MKQLFEGFHWAFNMSLENNDSASMKDGVSKTKRPYMQI